MKRATALLVVLAGLAGAGLGVWRPWAVSRAPLSSAPAAEDARQSDPPERVDSTVALAVPHDAGVRERVGELCAGELRLLLRTNAPCGHAMEVPVTVATKDASENRVLRIGEPSSWSVSGEVRVEAGGFGWLPTSHIVNADQGSEVVLDVLPRAVMVGRVRDALDGGPIGSFGLRVESMLERSDQGTHTHVGSRNAIASPDGSFCNVPLQEALAHRLTIDAPGYETYRTDWVSAIPGDPLDVGEVLLAPAPTRRLEVHIVDAATGTPVLGAAVLVATFPLETDDLVLAGERVAPVPSFERGERGIQTARTDAEGVARLAVPVDEPLWVGAWKDPFRLRLIEHPSIPEDRADKPVMLVVELTRGPRIEGLLLLGPDLRALVRHIHLEVRGEGARRQLPIELVEPLDAIPFEVGGLSPGPVELWVVAREMGTGARLRRALIATQTLALTGSQTFYVQLDCGVPFGEGVVYGNVSAPEGEELVSLRAFAATDRGSAVARRTVPVHDNHFVLSGCEAPRTVVGVQGFDSSGAVQALWIGDVDGTLNPTVSVDLVRSVVHGHAGDLSHLPMEEIAIIPVDDHPLVGVPLATVTAYPGTDGEFTVYGLPPGAYRAVGAYSRLEAEFRVTEGSVDVRLQLSETGR